MPSTTVREVDVTDLRPLSVTVLPTCSFSPGSNRAFPDVSSRKEKVWNILLFLAYESTGLKTLFRYLARTFSRKPPLRDRTFSQAPRKTMRVQNTQRAVESSEDGELEDEEESSEKDIFEEGNACGLPMFTLDGATGNIMSDSPFADIVPTEMQNKGGLARGKDFMEFNELFGHFGVEKKLEFGHVFEDGVDSWMRDGNFQKDGAWKPPVEDQLQELRGIFLREMGSDLELLDQALEELRHQGPVSNQGGHSISSEEESHDSSKSGSSGRESGRSNDLQDPRHAKFSKARLSFG